MQEHANEIIPYLMTVLGFLIVYVLNGIRGEIREVKNMVKNLETDLRGGVAALDRRVTHLEAQCPYRRHAVGCDS